MLMPRDIFIFFEIEFRQTNCLMLLFSVQKCKIYFLKNWQKSLSTARWLMFGHALLSINFNIPHSHPSCWCSGIGMVPYARYLGLNYNSEKKIVWKKLNQ